MHLEMPFSDRTGLVSDMALDETLVLAFYSLVSRVVLFWALSAFLAALLAALGVCCGT